MTPLLRVNKVDTMISVLENEHMRSDPAHDCNHDDYEVMVDIKVDQEELDQLKKEELKLNLNAAKFLYFKQISNDRRFPILTLEETKAYFANALKAHMTKFKKTLYVEIKLHCCGQAFIIKEFTKKIPATVPARDVCGVKVPLLDLPNKNLDGTYQYSRQKIKEQLELKYKI